MKIKRYILILFTLLLFKADIIKGQTPVDNLMMDAGAFCGAVTYTHDSWSKYWEGKLLRDNRNIGTLTRQTIMPMFALGLTKKINLLVAMPYVSTAPSAGQFIGQSGFQDLGVWLKARLINWETETGTLTLHGVAGASTPVTDYNKDYQPFSLGLGAKELSMRAILHYQLSNGIFVRGSFSGNVRDNIEIERDYYFTTEPVYSNQVDMPNAVMYGVQMGAWLFNNSFNIFGNFEVMNSLSGHDIRRQDMPFPSNKMNMTRAGLNLQYYTPFLKGLSFIASAGQVISGRNMGKSAMVTGGLSYQFGIWNK